MAQECIFCRIIKGEIPCSKVYENNSLLAFLDIAPLSQGHCLLVPKEHVVRPDTCPSHILIALTQQIGPLAKAIITTAKTDSYNVLVNCGRNAGQLVDHLHLHIIPRFTSDNALSHCPPGKYPPGRMEELAHLIGQSL
jgi:histidine triad (HIT) family protein